MLQFEHPWAFLLLLPLILLRWWPRMRVRAYLAVNMPVEMRSQIPVAAQPRWITRLPSQCLYGFLVVLIVLISDPYVGTQETYEGNTGKLTLLNLGGSLAPAEADKPIGHPLF